MSSLRVNSTSIVRKFNHLWSSPSKGLHGHTRQGGWGQVSSPYLRLDRGCIRDWGHLIKCGDVFRSSILFFIWSEYFNCVSFYAISKKIKNARIWTLHPVYYVFWFFLVNLDHTQKKLRKKVQGPLKLEGGGAKCLGGTQGRIQSWTSPQGVLQFIGALRHDHLAPSGWTLKILNGSAFNALPPPLSLMAVLIIKKLPKNSYFFS